MTTAKRTYLVTGASTGLGLAVSRRFAQEGAHVVMVCRSQEKGQDAVLDIRKTAPESSVDLMLCDLASLKSIYGFLSDFRARYSKLDLLFNNAAVMKRKRTITDDGFETMFQVNYLAPFLLSKELLGSLKGGEDPTIINVTLPAEKYRVDFDDLQFAEKYGQWDSFFHTKLYLMMSTLELSRRPESDGICVMAQVPGTFKSELVREAGWPVGWFKNLFSQSVDAAADNMLYVATSPEAGRGTGRIFLERNEKPPAEYWKDIGTRERLWSVTESLIAEAR